MLTPDMIQKLRLGEQEHAQSMQQGMQFFNSPIGQFSGREFAPLAMQVAASRRGAHQSQAKPTARVDDIRHLGRLRDLFNDTGDFLDPGALDILRGERDTILDRLSAGEASGSMDGLSESFLEEFAASVGGR